MKRTTTTTERLDIFASVTDAIIAELEKGPEAWSAGWCSSADVWDPRNLETGKAYRGVNVLVLALTMLQRGYTQNLWLTFNQARARGGNVRKGSKGVHLVFWRPITRKNDGDNTTDDTQGDDEDGRKRMMAKPFVVFNVADCDGVNAPIDATPEEGGFSRLEAAESIITASGAEIQPGRPSYLPDLDIIRLPERSAFLSAESYYATAFHELTHWTAPRVSREVQFKRWGDESYAMEELVAELGAAMLCGVTGVPALSQCAAYLNSWIRVLKSDKRAIFSVAGRAQKAADYLLSRAGLADEEERDQSAA
ncbi:MAG: hypothetical protein RL385_2453 [Pseudomonadota bacterium]|jgi:antirestriction protein ArdC